MPEREEPRYGKLVLWLNFNPGNWQQYKFSRLVWFQKRNKFRIRLEVFNMFCKIFDRKQSCPARVENFDQQRRQSFDTGGRKHSLTLPFTSYFFRPKGIQLKFAMVGAPAVGKSALLVKFLTGRFIGEYIKGYF